MHPNIPEPGPWSVGDGVGFQVAIAQLKLSLSSGHNEPTRLQYDTIRKLRTAWSHCHEISAEAHAAELFGFRNLLGKSFTNSSCPAQSRFFKKVMEGMLHRMGKQTKPNMGLEASVPTFLLGTMTSLKFVKKIKGNVM